MEHQGYSAPLTDEDPLRGNPHGVWLNRVHGYEVEEAGTRAARVHFPRSCLHCETPACVTVCPTGASYKRAEDGIVLVNPDTCIGCKLCSWACPYGAREYDYDDGVMKKCTLCIDRIYNENLDGAGGPHPGLRARLPDRRAAFRRSRRSGKRGVAAGQGARAASTCCRNWASSRSTSICRRAPRKDPATRRARRGELPVSAAPGSNVDRFFAWVDKTLSR